MDPLGYSSKGCYFLDTEIMLFQGAQGKIVHDWAIV